MSCKGRYFKTQTFLMVKSPTPTHNSHFRSPLSSAQLSTYSIGSHRKRTYVPAGVKGDRFFAPANRAIRSSDPVIEPMLQSIPDPFDSYGQAHSEDQIFSILPPLSILAPSSSPSPLTVTPQTVTSDVFATGTSVGWAHGNGILYSDMASEWADAVPSSASSSLPKTPTTKNRSSSPPRRTNRTSSSPPGSGSRRAESKLRSVLSVIDEVQQQKQADNAVPTSSSDAAAVVTATVVPATNGPSESAEARDSGASWTNFPFGEGEHPRSDSQSTTPRHSVSDPASSTEDVSQGDAQGRKTPESDRPTSPISS